MIDVKEPTLRCEIKTFFKFRRSENKSAVGWLGLHKATHFISIYIGSAAAGVSQLSITLYERCQQKDSSAGAVSRAWHFSRWLCAINNYYYLFIYYFAACSLRLSNFCKLDLLH